MLEQHNEDKKEYRANSRNIIADFRDNVFAPNPKRIRDYFDFLVKTTHKNFNAKVVTVWAYNYKTDTLVLQSSYPKRMPDDGEFSIDAASSFTGFSVKKCSVSVHSNLTIDFEGRKFASPKLLSKYDLKSMRSIPVKRLSNPRIISFVLNIYYDVENVPKCPLNDIEMQRVVGDLELALDYLMTQKFKRIGDSILKNVPKMTGIQSLFDAIIEPLNNFVNAKNASLYIYDTKNNIFKSECSTNKNYPKILNEYAKISNDYWDSNLEGRELFNSCLRKKNSYIHKTKESSRKSRAILNPLMAIPILSISNDVIGILICADPFHYSEYGGSFSSLDVGSTEKLSQTIAPYLENFLRLKEHSTLTKLVENISNVMPKPGQLDVYLNDLIGKIVKSLRAEVGSIYLFKGQSDELEMAAGYGANKSLINIAKYALDDGLTGAVAKYKKIINLKSKEDVLQHPNYLGKHDNIIYRGTLEMTCNNFIGIPIIIKNKVVGVLKAANIKPDKEHPNSYFTEEDEQALKVIVCFIAYSIELEKKWKHLNLLVSETNNIQNATNQEEAINLAMVAIESSGYNNSVISLYEEETGLIKGYLSTGRWAQLENYISFKYDSNSQLAEILKGNKPKLMSNRMRLNEGDNDDSLDERFNIESQYILPLRLEEEIIGILQIDMSGEKAIDENDELILNAFAKHLSITLSRRRKIQQFKEMTDKVMSSSRFIVAETLSSMAVHSTKHCLKRIVHEIDQELNKKEIRENRDLFEPFNNWKNKLNNVKSNLSEALHLVKTNKTKDVYFNIHEEIQSCIKMWYGHIKESNCEISCEFNAKNRFSDIASHALNEIISVLIVNSVQAHSKKIKIITEDFGNTTFKSDTFYYGKKKASIVFTDNGDGIHIDKPEKIFEPSYSTKHEKYGTGLGLFIAKKIAMDCGGNLEVKTHKPGVKGVSFLLNIPAISEMNEEVSNAESN